MTKVELFEQIRIDFDRRGKSVRAIARDRRIGRRLVRQALASAVPPPRRAPTRARLVFTEAHRRLVDEWLRADLEAPRKQRHTARRIFVRLREETATWLDESSDRVPFLGAEPTVRVYVSRRKAELGLLRREVFVPLQHPPGLEAEVDWYDAEVQFPDGPVTVHVLQMRACHSGREFHMAFPRMHQQCFLAAQVEALRWFGGVFSTIRYDNLKAAVVKVLKGRSRDESDRFVAFRSHYGFEAAFCNVAKGNEKGGVESGVGRFRRSHLVPVPVVESFEDLNRRLLLWCVEDEQRRVGDRPVTVGEAWKDEVPNLRPLPDKDFETNESETVRVDKQSCIKVDTNRYSVPVSLAHREVEVRKGPLTLEIWHNGQCAAVHPRLSGSLRERLVLDHYLELLDRKPRAFSASRPLARSRESGEWPAEFESFLKGLIERCGEANGTRHMIRVLLLLREHESSLVEIAVGLAVEYGTFGHQAVEQLIGQLSRKQTVAEPLEALGSLASYDRPKPDTRAYDRLLPIALAAISPLSLILEVAS